MDKSKYRKNSRGCYRGMENDNGNKEESHRRKRNWFTIWIQYIYPWFSQRQSGIITRSSDKILEDKTRKTLKQKIYKKRHNLNMQSSIISSPIGDLVAIATDSHLVMLEFADSPSLEGKLQILLPLVGGVRGGTIGIPLLASPKKGEIENIIIEKTKKELEQYFAWTRKIFDIPLAPRGTEFQQKAWKALESIPYGETRSYQEEATLIGNPKAVRAIGGANNQNPIVIIIPCHRVIGKSWQLVGYGGWLDRKIWLLKHENTKKSQ